MSRLNPYGTGSDSTDSAPGQETLAPAKLAEPMSPSQLAKFLLKSVDLRQKLFGRSHVHDPFTNMLLDLFLADEKGKRVTVTDLCLAARVPATTALRWISVMETEGLLARRADHGDMRRVLVELTPQARSLILKYLQRLAHAL